MSRITIDLDDRIATALDRWMASTAGAVGGQLEAGEAIGAMIVTTLRYADVSDAVASQIRHQRAALPGEG